MLGGRSTGGLGPNVRPKAEATRVNTRAWLVLGIMWLGGVVLLDRGVARPVGVEPARDIPPPEAVDGCRCALVEAPRRIDGGVGAMTMGWKERSIQGE